MNLKNDTTDNVNTQLAIGTLLQGGKYRIERYLASGGFGNTYVATNTSLEQTVVIKEFFMRGITGRANSGTMVTITLAENNTVWEKMLNKFKHEAQHLYTLNHRNIVRVYDYFAENDTAYYVMELVKGESLSGRIKREQRPLAAEEALGIISQTMDALEYIHSTGLYHLDIKPANLLVDATNTVKIIDFGASKQTTAEHQMTTTNLSFTPRYAAPEQMMQMKKGIGSWTDIYSLGATWFYLLTGQAPPASLDIEDAGRDAFKAEGFVLNEGTIDVLSKIMEPVRKNRPQTIAEVRQLIANHIDDLKTSPVSATATAAPQVEEETKTTATEPQPEKPVEAQPLKEPEEQPTMFIAGETESDGQAPRPEANDSGDEDTITIQNQAPRPEAYGSGDEDTITIQNQPSPQSSQASIPSPVSEPKEETQFVPDEPEQKPELPVVPDEPKQKPELPDAPAPEEENKTALKGETKQLKGSLADKSLASQSKKNKVKKQPAVAGKEEVSKLKFEAIPRQQPAPKKVEKPAAKPSRMPIIIAVVVGFIVALGCGLFLLGRGGGADNENIAEASLEQVIEVVENFEVKINDVTCTYSGEVDDQHRPNGKGEVKYPAGQYYSGEFSHGTIEGEGTYVIPASVTGDGEQRFEGTMKDNKFSKGKFTYVKDGCYFEGTFKNETFCDGEYKDKDGKVLATYKDGKQV